MGVDIIALSEKLNIVLVRLPDGKIRATSNAWDEPKMLLKGQALEARYYNGTIQVVRKAFEHDEAAPAIAPYNPYGPPGEPEDLTETSPKMSSEEDT